MPDLHAEIRAFIDGWNNERTYPFTWTKAADEVLTKAKRPTTPKPRHWSVP